MHLQEATRSGTSVTAADPFRAGRRRLRVLDITDFYSETLSGGVKTYLRAKARALAGLEVEHAMVVPSDRDGVDRLGETRVYRLRGPVVPVSPAYRVILSSRALRPVLERERPDVIEIGSPFIVPRLVRRALGSRRVATVGFYHADLVRTFAEPYVPHRAAAPIRVLLRTLARRLVRSVYRRFDATVAASRSVADELRRLGVPDVRHVGLGVELDRFRPDPPGGPADPSEWGVAPGKTVGIYVGRFCAEKRLDVLLDGHATLPVDTRPHLVFIGGGPHQDRLEAVAGERADVTVLPYLSDRDLLARSYAGADFYLASGPGETFGLSIGEALASGLPVLCVDRGAGPDRIEGADVGTLYRHGDPESAAAGLMRMTERVDAEAGAMAREHAETTLNWDRTFSTLVELYRQVARAQTGD